jgi:hypothetical protein
MNVAQKFRFRSRIDVDEGYSWIGLARHVGNGPQIVPVFTVYVALLLTVNEFFGVLRAVRL